MEWADIPIYDIWSKTWSKTRKNAHSSAFLSWLCWIAAFIGGTLIAQKIAGSVSRELSAEEAQQIVDTTLTSLPKSVSTGAVYVAENTKVTVNDVSYGSERT